MDQEATLYPAPPKRFSSHEDVVDRLLPYHIWQIHDQELESGSEKDSAREKKGVLSSLIDVHTAPTALADVQKSPRHPTLQHVYKPSMTAFTPHGFAKPRMLPTAHRSFCSRGRHS
jgi:hypothetical protein